MPQARDTKGDLRSAFALREIGKAQRKLHGESGAAGVFIRVTLALLFMYLIFISHQALGAAGPVIVSAVFIAALLSPLLYRALTRLLARRPERAEDASEVFMQESRQKS